MPCIFCREDHPAEACPRAPRSFVLRAQASREAMAWQAGVPDPAQLALLAARQASLQRGPATSALQRSATPTPGSKAMAFGAAGSPAQQAAAQALALAGVPQRPHAVGAPLRSATPVRQRGTLLPAGIAARLPPTPPHLVHPMAMITKAQMDALPRWRGNVFDPGEGTVRLAKSLEDDLDMIRSDDYGIGKLLDSIQEDGICSVDMIVRIADATGGAVGNCFEQACLAFKSLHLQGACPLRLVIYRRGGSHIFTIAGDGPGAMVCDPWAEVYCTVDNYMHAMGQRMQEWYATGKGIAAAGGKVDPREFFEGLGRCSGAPDVMFKWEGQPSSEVQTRGGRREWY